MGEILKKACAWVHDTLLVKFSNLVLITRILRLWVGYDDMHNFL